MESAASLGSKAEHKVKRLEGLVGRFTEFLGRHFEGHYKYISSISSAQPEWPLIHSSVQSNSPFHKDGTDYFPIFADGFLCGAIQRTGNALPHEDETRIQELVRTLLNETLELLVDLETLERLDSQIQLSESHRQVIQISEFKKYRNTTHDYDEPTIRMRRFLPPCLIESKDLQDAFKMALELHEESGRFAFLSYWDLDKETRTSAEALSELGMATIYIPEVELMNACEQEALLKLMSQSRGEHAPYWISATSVPYPSLLRRRSIDTRLLKHLSISYLRINKSIENLLGLEHSTDLH